MRKLFRGRRSGQDRLGIPDSHQVVCTDRPPHKIFAHVLIFVLTQPGYGLEKISERQTLVSGY